MTRSVVPCPVCGGEHESLNVGEGLILLPCHRVPTGHAVVTQGLTADELEDASLDRALEDVRAERGRQDARWGEQNQPDGTSLSLEHTAAREAARQECDLAAAAGAVTWRHILNEEVREAFAETSVEALRRELVQVAAVAVAWIEDLDRRVKP